MLIMKSTTNIVEQAKDVLKIEAQGILDLIEKLDNRFARMVELIHRSKGRVIVSGIGKSGIVGRKIVATLNSTGTHSLFLHPVEAMHGDLGMVDKRDVFLALSNSGETEELNALLPKIRSIGCKIIAFTGNETSTLANQSDIVIYVGVKQEACSLVPAPTASTTATLAMGDALAVSLMNKIKFNSKDFKKLHPGGSLGQRLSMNVYDLMLKDDSIPTISITDTMSEALNEINRVSMGVTFVIDKDSKITGIITDGDIRRLIAQNKQINELSVSEVMTQSPRCFQPDSPAYDALNLMEKHQITVLPIVNEEQHVIGILHLHDILGKGEFKFNEQT